MAGLGRLMVCLATLAALFAMHGPSSDHMLEMPTDAAAMTIMTSASPTHEPAESLRHVPVGDHLSLTPRSREGGTVAAPCVGSSMGHPQCVATLRGLPQLASALTATTTAPAVGVAQSRRLIGVGATPRAPPQPSLDKLCISRT